MSGIFGVAKEKCMDDLFYGTDYHSHLGTEYGGLVVLNGAGSFQRQIHRISEDPFRAKLEEFRQKFNGDLGIGVICDYEPQPLIINSHLGQYAIVHVGKITNLDELVEKAHRSRTAHFVESSGDKVNPTELVATLINKGDNFVDGIEIMQNSIQGSSSLMLLTKEGIYLARDKYGRTPLVVGKGERGMAATLETTAFPNLDFQISNYLGPGEIGFMTKEKYEQLKKPEDKLQTCAFLWIYYGYPTSDYEDINVEIMRNNSGRIHGKIDENEKLQVDLVAGIPDSGTGHALGYSEERKIPYKRPFVKYTPTWPRSFMPQVQEIRDKVAKMKLIPIPKLIKGKKLLFCEDSIVRATQLKPQIKRLFDIGASEVHMRPACPPLIYTCRYLNFSRSTNEFDLAGKRAIRKLEGENANLEPYMDENSEHYKRMVDVVRKEIGLTSLRYQKLDDLVSAIGLPKERLCLGCWRA